MMRAIRHAARIDFTIEEQTWKALCSNSHKLSLCPPSRLRDEFLKDLYSGAAAPWFELAVDSGLLFSLFPFYRKTLSSNSAASRKLREQLAGICRIIDRTNTLSLNLKIHRQPDFFLIGLLLIPWVEARFQLISQFRKGALLFQLSKQIREEIDQSIGIDLNLRRSLRQEMVSLLLNLSLLIHNKQQNGWPKWLKRKSYFKRSVLFYHLYMAATTGTSVDHLFLDEPQIQPAAEEINKVSRKSSPPKCKPAFSNKSKGGIFGFKK
jgi:poly(A) polymerase